MILGDGIISIVRDKNIAEIGEMPRYEPHEILRSYYGEKTVGVNRYYTAKGQNDSIDMLIQIQRTKEIQPSTDRACIAGTYYRITQLQQVTDEDGLPMTDLSLERINGLE